MKDNEIGAIAGEFIKKIEGDNYKEMLENWLIEIVDYNTAMPLSVFDLFIQLREGYDKGIIQRNIISTLGVYHYSIKDNFNYNPQYLKVSKRN